MKELSDDVQIQQRADFLFHEQWQAVITRTDHMMAGLMVVQWIGAVVCALTYSNTAWAGSYSFPHPHVVYALLLGGLITALPVALAMWFSGKVWTRNCIAVCQMLMSSLLIHLSGGRIETHFHVFGSLAILAFYRDWRVLLWATVVVAIDHFVRGTWFPLSVFGVATAQPLRWIEHALWVAFEDVFLIIACLQNIAEMKTMAQRQAALEAANEAKDLLRELASTQEELTKQAGEVGLAVDSLYGAGQKMTASISELASNAQQTLTAITETTTIVDEVRQTAEISSQKARKVCEDAQGVLNISEHGKTATDEAVKGMNRIRDQMESIAESMVHLSDQSKLIGDIIAVVDDLAQQSNLLSVNASIEAAKAGEHGKGFAVVAQEVKDLSRQSKDATAHVRRILSDIGKAITAATMATELGTKAVGAGEEVANQARDAILTLSANVGQSAHASTQIEVSSQQQLVGMQQVVAAMESVRQASDHNVRSVGDLESAVTNLNDLGRRLKDLTNRYENNGEKESGNGSGRASDENFVVKARSIA